MSRINGKIQGSAKSSRLTKEKKKERERNKVPGMSREKKIYRTLDFCVQLMARYNIQGNLPKENK